MCVLKTTDVVICWQKQALLCQCFRINTAAEEQAGFPHSSSILHTFSTHPQQLKLCFHTLSLVAANDKRKSQLYWKSPEGMSLLHWQIRNVNSDLKRKALWWPGIESQSSLSEFTQKGLEVLRYLEVGAQEKCNNVLRRLKNKLYWKTLENRELGKNLKQTFYQTRHFTVHQAGKVYPSNFKLSTFQKKKKIRGK